MEWETSLDRQDTQEPPAGPTHLLYRQLQEYNSVPPLQESCKFVCGSLSFSLSLSLSLHSSNLCVLIHVLSTHLSCFQYCYHSYLVPLLLGMSTVCTVTLTFEDRRVLRAVHVHVYVIIIVSVPDLLQPCALKRYPCSDQIRTRPLLVIVVVQVCMYTYMYKYIFAVGLFITSNPCHRVCQETLSRQCSTQVSSVFCYCWLNKDTLVFHDVFLMNKLVDLFVTGTLIMYPCFHGALSIVAMVSKGSVHVCSYICPD